MQNIGKSVIASATAVLLLGAGFYWLPTVANSVVSDALVAQTDQYDQGLLKRIQFLESKIEELVVEAEQNSKTIAESSQKIVHMITVAEKKLGVLRTSSGEISMSKNEFPNLLNPNGCEANRGIVNKTVVFDQPFNTVPTVLLSFSTIDMGHGQDHRLKLKIQKVSEIQFTYSFSTWCDTRMSKAEASWIAIGA